MPRRNILGPGGAIVGVVDEPDSPQVLFSQAIENSVAVSHQSAASRNGILDSLQGLGPITVNLDTNNGIRVDGIPPELRAEVQRVLNGFIGQNITPVVVDHIRRVTEQMVTQHQQRDWQRMVAGIPAPTEPQQSARNTPYGQSLITGGVMSQLQGLNRFQQANQEIIQSRLSQRYGGRPPSQDPSGDPAGDPVGVGTCLFDLTIQPIYSMQVQYPLEAKNISVTFLLEDSKKSSPPPQFTEVVLNEEELQQEKWFAPVKVTGYQTPWGFIHEPDRVKLFLYKLNKLDETVSKFLVKVNAKIGTGGQFEPEDITKIIRGTLMGVRPRNNDTLAVRHNTDNAVVLMSEIINACILAGVYFEEIEEVLEAFHFNNDKYAMIEQIKQAAYLLGQKVGRRLGDGLVPMPIKNCFTGPVEVTILREKSTPDIFRNNLIQPALEESSAFIEI